MKRKKQSKRQLLNALLDAEEAQRKITASQERLDMRIHKLQVLREELSHQLSDVIENEHKKAGVEYDINEENPIVFKNCIFSIWASGGAFYSGEQTYKCDITRVNNVS